MDPISHCLVGAATSCLATNKRHKEVAAALVTGGIAALLPDLDVLIRSSQDPLLQLEYHRQFTHSLIFIPVGAFIAYLFALFGLSVFRITHPTRSRTFLYAFLGYGSHGFLDTCTSYGTLLFWPFSSARVAWSIIGIIDPIFTLSILVLLILALVKKNGFFGRLAFLFALLYLSLGFFQNQRAEEVAMRSMSDRNVQLSPRGCEAKPSPLTLSLWRTICESSDGLFLTNAWYLGFLGGQRQYAGLSVPKLFIERDLPWLEEGTRQYQDFKRFEWFSSGFVTLHPEHKNVVGDLRYSLIPSRVDPLWGIILDPLNRDPERPTPFQSFRNIKDGDYEIYFAMILGREVPLR